MEREFKDSGIEWIGKIPKEWNMQRLKSLCTIQTGNQDTQDAEPDGIYPFYVRSPLIERSNKYSFEGEGILMAGDGVGAGRVFHLASGKYAVHQRVYRLANIKSININYLYYFVSNLFCREMDRGSAQSTVPSVRLPMLQNFNICIPPKDYQQRIADYLDKKCGEIDELIALQEQMIAHLTDYKQSVITEAVTKGLNPDVELIPSGIDWIGDVPKGWKVNKVNRMFGVIGSGTTPNSSDDDAYMGTINWLQSGDINGGILTKANKRISEETLAKYSALSIFKAPFIIVAMYGASVGNISISHIDACVNQACCVLGDSTIDFTYAFYAIKSSQRYLIYRAVGGGQPNISQYTLRQLWVPEPPLSEQQSIATYLDTKCSEIDSLIAIKQQKIETLKDYKKSVIYEAVTGKMSIGETP